MPEITTTFQGQTVITTFEVSPGTAHDLIEALQEGAVDGQPSHELREVDVRPSPPPHPENNPAP